MTERESVCVRERGKRREGESKRDRAHERQFGGGGKWEACREKN